MKRLFLLGIVLLFVLIIFSILILLRFILYFVLRLFSKLYYLKYNFKSKQNKNNTEPHDDLLRDKEKENKDIFENVEKIGGKIEETHVKYNNQERVVGIIKSVGFWTSLILGDKLSEILLKNQALSEGKNNFWVNLIKLKRDGNVNKDNSQLMK